MDDIKKSKVDSHIKAALIIIQHTLSLTDLHLNLKYSIYETCNYCTLMCFFPHIREGKIKLIFYNEGITVNLYEGDISKKTNHLSYKDLFFILEISLRERILIELIFYKNVKRGEY